MRENIYDIKAFPGRFVSNHPPKRKPNGFISKRGGKLVDCNGKPIILRASREVEVIAERMRAELRALREKANRILEIQPLDPFAAARKIEAAKERAARETTTNTLKN